MTPFDIDLTCVSDSLTSINYKPTPWPKHAINYLELIYRRFLFLLLKYEDVIIAPTIDIDEYWHAHILFTKKYRSDCLALCGRFIDHDPDLSVDSDNDQKNSSSSSIIFALYEESFNEKLMVYRK